ncbi:hypothetical protein BLOT_001935 [Blomia tropicalis]|nr:hypothetical protein BLOT_001935 [Blomia tropicalis]
MAYSSGKRLANGLNRENPFPIELDPDFDDQLIRCYVLDEWCRTIGFYRASIIPLDGSHNRWIRIHVQEDEITYEMLNERFDQSYFIDTNGEVFCDLWYKNIDYIEIRDQVHYRLSCNMFDKNITFIFGDPLQDPSCERFRNFLVKSKFFNVVTYDDIEHHLNPFLDRFCNTERLLGNRIESMEWFYCIRNRKSQKTTGEDELEHYRFLFKVMATIRQHLHMKLNDNLDQIRWYLNEPQMSYTNIVESFETCTQAMFWIVCNVNQFHELTYDEFQDQYVHRLLYRLKHYRQTTIRRRRRGRRT